MSFRILLKVQMPWPFLALPIPSRSSEMNFWRIQASVQLLSYVLEHKSYHKFLHYSDLYHFQSL